MKRERKELMEALLRDTREDIGRADAKASTLFGIAGVVIGVLLAGIIAGDWSPVDDLRDGEALWWIGCALTLGGLACLGCAVYPQIGHPASHKDKVAYFGHVDAFETLEEFIEAVDDLDDSEVEARTADQAYRLSEIVMTKYRFVRYALWLFGFGAAFAALGIAIG